MFKGHKTAEQLEIEPDRYQQCPHWAWFKEKWSGKRHKRACKKCRHCRDFKHERIVGQTIAQAQTSSSVMSFTLTYDPAHGIERLDYEHVEKFLKRLRKAGYRFTKVCAGEYGGDNGAPHWHALLLFEWDLATKARILDAISQGEEYSRITGPDWHKLVVPHVANVTGQAFKDAINDPETLVVSYPQRGKKTAKIRNFQWKFWPWGIVEAQIVKSPGFSDPEHVEGAARYPLKYLSKDAWKDSRKYQRTPFDLLPEHIKQQTRFGPWRTAEQIIEAAEKEASLGVVDRTATGGLPIGQEHRKWSLGNPYVKELKKALLRDFDSEDEIPVERQLMVGQYHYKARCGLGADFFRAKGRYHANNPGLNDENLRLYEVGANYKPTKGNENDVEAGAHRWRKTSDGRVIAFNRKRYKHSMGDTSFRQFWKGFNEEKVALNEGQSLGPECVVELLETTQARASDASSGGFGYHYWKKTSRSSRRSIEDNLAMVPDEQLRGFFPTRWRRQMETTSRNIYWREKGLKRQLAEIQADEKKHGFPLPELVAAMNENVKGVARILYNPTGNMPAEERADLWNMLEPYKAEVARWSNSTIDPEIYQNLPPDNSQWEEQWINREVRIEKARERKKTKPPRVQFLENTPSSLSPS